MMQSRPIYGMEMGDNYLCTQYIAKKTLFLQKKEMSACYNTFQAQIIL